MVESINFQLNLTGDTADRHRFHGYDGYMSLAGFAWTLALVANYAETGKIRQRGDFPGRDAVQAGPLERGSILADFTVLLQQNPAEVLSAGGLIVGATVGAFFSDLVRRVISRNIGQDEPAQTPLLEHLLKGKDGDIEALVAKTEPAIRQAHGVIGKGASQIQVLGGFNILNTLNPETRDYVKLNIEEDIQKEGIFSVAAFNVNSGYGSVFDFGLRRTIPIIVARSALPAVKSVFTWGLDQYANRTGGSVKMAYTRILAMDGTPKKYVVLSAEKILK